MKAIWPTLQGEGAWAGRPAVFVRLVGCNMWSGYAADRARAAERTGAACPLWCDTDFTKEDSQTYAAAALADAVAEAGARGPTPIRFTVLTGGEPLLQADARLVAALHARGFEVAVETNGTVRLADAFADTDGALAPPDWVVCSPKLPADRVVLEWMDELKLVVPDYRPEAYATVASRVRAHRVGAHDRHYLWLQPEDGPRQAAATALAIDLALANPAWRVSVQTHKVLGVE